MFTELTVCVHIHPYHNKIVKRAEVHLQLATKARSYLKSQVKSGKETIKDHFTDKGLAVPPVGACLAPVSNTITMHFSFDMAQQVCIYTPTLNTCLIQLTCQVHYPSDPQQPGPMYFLTPRKCGIFGICCAAIPRQVCSI